MHGQSKLPNIFIIVSNLEKHTNWWFQLIWTTVLNHVGNETNFKVRLNIEQSSKWNKTYFACKHQINWTSKRTYSDLLKVTLNDLKAQPIKSLISCCHILLSFIVTIILRKKNDFAPCEKPPSADFIAVS